MILDKLPPFPVGGAEIQAIRLAKYLTKNGVKVCFLTPGRNRIKGKDYIEGMPVYRLHSILNYPWDWASSFKKLLPPPRTRIEYNDDTEVTNEVIAPVGLAVQMRYLIFLINSIPFFLLNRHKFDIIHVHSMEWPSFIGARLSKWFGKKLVIKDATMNGIFGLKKRFPSGNKKFRLIIKQGHFVAISRVIHENFLKVGVPLNRISRIPNGIEAKGARFKSNYQSKLKKVIFVGNLTQQPAKGVDLLLKAWVIVTSKIKDVHLSIVGDGPLEDYQRYIDQLGLTDTVLLLGKRSDITELLISSDLFVLPSRREGMPNALMEAMLTGLPCIASDISGCQDLIQHNVEGLLVPPANVVELANAIEFLLKNGDIGARLGLNARKRIVESFDFELIANKYIELYSRILQ